MEEVLRVDAGTGGGNCTILEPYQKEKGKNYRTRFQMNMDISKIDPIICETLL